MWLVGLTWIHETCCLGTLITTYLTNIGNDGLHLLVRQKLLWKIPFHQTAWTMYFQKKAYKIPHHLYNSRSWGLDVIVAVNGIMGYRQPNDRYTFWNVLRHILLFPSPSFVFRACLVMWHAIITRFLITVPIRRLFTGCFMGWHGPMLSSPIIRRML